MNFIFSAVDWLVANHVVIESVIGKAAIAAAFTRTNWDNRVLNWVSALIHIVAVDPQRAKAAINNSQVVTVNAKGFNS